MSTNPSGSVSFTPGAWGDAPKVRYVKWCLATRQVLDVNTFSWPLDCDGFIYYREPNPGDSRWYAYASRTGIGRMLYPESVPAEVKLALVLTQ